MKTLNALFNHVSIAAFLFFANSAFASKDDPFKDLGERAQEGTDSLLNIAIPIFVFALTALIILRAINVIGNRFLVIAALALFGIALVPVVVPWAMGL